MTKSFNYRINININLDYNFDNIETKSIYTIQNNTKYVVKIELTNTLLNTKKKITIEPFSCYQKTINLTNYFPGTIPFGYDADNIKIYFNDSLKHNFKKNDNNKFNLLNTENYYLSEQNKEYIKNAYVLN